MLGQEVFGPPFSPNQILNLSCTCFFFIKCEVLHHWTFLGVSCPVCLAENGERCAHTPNIAAEPASPWPPVLRVLRESEDNSNHHQKKISHVGHTLHLFKLTLSLSFANMLLFYFFVYKVKLCQARLKSPSNAVLTPKGLLVLLRKP